MHYNSRVVIKSPGPGIFPGYWESGPRLLLLENRRKIEPKEIPSRLIPCLLVVFTRQLEILVTTLNSISVCALAFLHFSSLVPDNVLLETPKCSWHNVIIWQLNFCRYSLQQIVSVKLCKKWANFLNDKFSTCLFSELISMEFSSSFLRLHLPWK